MRPKALPEDQVVILNPRTEGTEDAVVTMVETRWHSRKQGGYYHNYRVMLARRSKKGNRIFLWLGDLEIISRRTRRQHFPQPAQ